jgi:uncharacterized protein (DUF433 family)
MKLKSAIPVVIWGSHDVVHHKDKSQRARTLESWRPSMRPVLVQEQWERATCLDASSGYPAALQKLFKDAIRRCPSISIDNDIMEGQPCIGGTRIPVRAVLRALEQCGSVQGVKNAYSDLTVDQVEDALYFSQIVLELPNGLDEAAIAP